MTSAHGVIPATVNCRLLHELEFLLKSMTLRERFQKDGFVIVHGLVSEREFTELQTACERVVDRTRSGGWPHRRVVGKQFPPFDSDNLDSWGVQHVMHPDLGEPIFARWYASETLVATVCELLECKEEDLQMGEFLGVVQCPLS